MSATEGIEEMEEMEEENLKDTEGGNMMSMD
jgi:hypothetical protein